MVDNRLSIDSEYIGARAWSAQDDDPVGATIKINSININNTQAQ